MGDDKKNNPMSLLTGAASGLLSGLFNIGSQKRAYKYNQKLMEQQNQYEKEAADLAYQRQLDFYERQLSDDRSYNDPAAVKQRYLAAGVNPNAAFGVAGSYKPLQPDGLSSVAPADVAQAPYMDPAAMTFGDPLEAAYKMAMIRKIDAEAEKTKNETPSADQFKEYYDSGIRLRNIEFDTKTIKKDQEALDYQLNLVTFDAKSKLPEMEGQRLLAQAELLNQQYENEIKRGDILAEQKDLIASQADLNVANTYLALATAAYRDSGIELNDAQISKLRAETATIDGLRDHLIKTNKFLAEQAKSDAAKKHFEENISMLGEKWIEQSSDWRKGNLGKNYTLFKVMGRTYSDKYGLWTESGKALGSIIPL